MSTYPTDLQYTNDHEWTRKEGTHYTVGITQFAVNQLGDVVMVEVSVKVGATVERGDAFGTIESVKAVSELYAPVTGRVTKINDKLKDEPELVNTDPYGAGWIIELEASGGTDDLLSPAAYEAHVKEE